MSDSTFDEGKIGWWGKEVSFEVMRKGREEVF
jgi:hypothetical protein